MEVGGVTVAVSLLTLAFLSVPFTADFRCPLGGCQFVFPNPNQDLPVFLGGLMTLALLVGVATVIAGIAGALLVYRRRPRPHA